MPNSLAMSQNEPLRAALAEGDPQKVRALLAAGADIRYQTESGYDALLGAVFGRDVLRDPRLMEMLCLLIDRGASVLGKSTYGETAVRVLSRIGRFDAVQLLLQAGARPEDVAFTPLIAAVAFGTLGDVQDVLARGVDLEERDWWERTAWLVAIQTGDIPKAHLLLAHGAHQDARGWCDKPPLFYAIQNGHLPMLEWLLERGQDVGQTDKFGNTALIKAAEDDDIQAVQILLRAGADVHQKSPGRQGSPGRRKSSGTGPLWHARTREIVRALLDAGADPQEVTTEGTRAVLGFPPEPDDAEFPVSAKDCAKHRTRRFGTQNPERMNNPFWEAMIRSGRTAFGAPVSVERTRKPLNLEEPQKKYEPTWCADRFGQSLTFLPDGRIVQVAGEHEDGSDPDFCIYNDVFVHDPDGNITIYGYPEAVFPPTDFHTATFVGEAIYLIGSVGYMGQRHYGTTPVYRLDTDTFRMERLETTGDAPGWIYKHRAVLSGAQEIRVTGGIVVTPPDDSPKKSVIPTISPRSP